MIKTLVKFEYVVEGKIGHFLLDHDTSFQAAKEMACQLLKDLVQLEDQTKAQEQAKQAASQPVQEVPKSEDMSNG